MATARKAVVKLDADHAALLRRLEAERGESASDVLRAGLHALANAQPAP